MSTPGRGLFYLMAIWLTGACGDDGPSQPTFTPSGPCDSGLTLNATDPTDAAKAMGICDGLVSASWVYPDGSAATVGGSFDVGHGLVTAFGASNAPREGAAMLALSSGTARTPSDPGYSADYDKGYAVTPPAGFPKNEAGCPTPSSTGRDGIGLRVVLVVPAGVRFFKLDYFFFTRDYPDWDCTSSIDQAAGLVAGIGGSSTVQNILLDAAGNPMFARPTTLRACTPSTGYLCSLGTSPLTGTGLTSGSGWVGSPNPAVTPGDTIRATFAIWDTLDGVGDSSLLLDDFAWIP